MSFRYSVGLRNAGLDARIARLGPAPVLKIFASEQGAGRDMLISIQLPTAWMGKAVNGVVTGKGPWTGMAVKDGEARSFGIYGNGESIEGSIPGEMKLDNTSIATDQHVTVTSFVISSGN